MEWFCISRTITKMAFEYIDKDVSYYSCHLYYIKFLLLYDFIHFTERYICKRKKACQSIKFVFLFYNHKSFSALAKDAIYIPNESSLKDNPII